MAPQLVIDTTKSHLQCLEAPCTRLTRSLYPQDPTDGVEDPRDGPEALVDDGEALNGLEKH